MFLCSKSESWRSLPDAPVESRYRIDDKDGHLLMIDTRKLPWPYLRKIVERDKTFRLECDKDTVFAELRHSADFSVTWSADGDEERFEKLEDLADAVYKRCKANLERKVQESSYHLRARWAALGCAVWENQKSLVFLMEDRAPHGWPCGRVQTLAPKADGQVVWIVL